MARFVSRSFRDANHLSGEEFEQLIVATFSAPVWRRGGNSSLGRTTWQGQEVVVKDFRARRDAVERATREWHALSALWYAGLRIAPKPIGADLGQGLVVMEWLNAEGFSQSFSTFEMLNLLSQLHELSARLHLGAVGKAADAITSPGDLRVQTLARLEMLGESPSVKVEVNRLRTTVQLLNLSTPLATEPVTTLSPSDFGSHNLVRTEEGIRIVDLEFFGWDDAHKLIADSTIHPLTSWNNASLDDFTQGSLELYELDESRLQVVRRGCFAKWCSIVLARADREFAAGDIAAHDASIVRAQRYLEAAAQF